MRLPPKVADEMSCWSAAQEGDEDVVEEVAPVAEDLVAGAVDDHHRGVLGLLGHALEEPMSERDRSGPVVLPPDEMRRNAEPGVLEVRQHETPGPVKTRLPARS